VDGSYNWTLTDDDGWLTSSRIIALSTTGSLVVQGMFALPSDCIPAAIDTVRFVATDLYIPGRSASCKTTIACTSVTGVGYPAAVAFSLGPARPNPSARGVTLPYGLPRASAVQLGIFGARGERVRALAAGPRPAGNHVATWDGRDERGRRVAPGVYSARIEAAGRTLERSVVVVR